MVFFLGRRDARGGLDVDMRRRGILKDMVLVVRSVKSQISLDSSLHIV